MQERIKEIRKKFEFTQKEFALRIGVATCTVTNYERGYCKPSKAVVSRICHEFVVNEDWLRNGVGEMFF